MLRDPPTTIIGLIHLELHIPLCRSLKEKRSVLKSCLHHLQNQLNVAVAEVGDQDVWKSAVIALTTVSGTKTRVERTLQQAEHYIEKRADIEVVASEIAVL